VISLTASRDEELLPLGPTWLGPPTDIQFNSQVELPAGYRPELPAAIHWKRDFAEYDATYAFKDGKLICERHLKTLLREAPVSEREAYKQLAKIMEDDYSKLLPLTSGSGSSMASGNASSSASSMSALWNLPDSSNEEATRLESEAREAMARKDPQNAVSSLYPRCRLTRNSLEPGYSSEACCSCRNRRTLESMRFTRLCPATQSKRRS
jgi:hypothetical protein